jgi:serine protease Do
MYKNSFLIIFSFVMFMQLAATAKRKSPTIAKGAFQSSGSLSSASSSNAFLSAAIEKGYKAAVLMWQIDGETGNRMSAQFSGVVVSADGLILSAAHVVMPGNTYKVMYADGRDCIAKGLGRITIPPNHMVPDAAMLKITGDGPWPYAEMGWSSSLSVGQPCISIAFPESLAQRKPLVRYGKISSLKNEYGFVQSTCVMEPGDSGGPLFDIYGRVIGIHSGIQVPEEVNYEVPVDTYRKYWTALLQAKDYQALPTAESPIAADPLKPSSFNAALVSMEKQAAQIGEKQKGTVLNIKSKLNGEDQQIAGTVLSLKGFSASKTGFVILSKSSMIGLDPVAKDSRGREIRLRVVARYRGDDVALLLAEKEPNGELQRSAVLLGESLAGNPSDGLSEKQLGTFLVSPRTDSSGQTGVLGSVQVNLPNATSYGYMGASTEMKDDQLRIKFVSPNNAAALAGLKAGDILSTINGAALADELDFMKAVGKHQAGDTIQVGLIREGQQVIKPVVLQYPPQRQGNHPAERFAGGKSIRRDGFSGVYIQDGSIKATECGGPVFDLTGRFIGINIARLSRTSTAILPAPTILPYLKGLRVE